MIRQTDFQGLSVVEYAKLTENSEIQDVIQKMVNGETFDAKSQLIQQKSYLSASPYLESRSLQNQSIHSEKMSPSNGTHFPTAVDNAAKDPPH